MSKILMAPFAIVTGLIAGAIAKRAFDFVWSQASDEEAPRPDQRDVSWKMLVPALLIEGAIFRAVKGAVDHGTRTGFARATGSWPGEEHGPEPA